MTTVKIIFGDVLKNRIARFMHKHGLIKVLYQVPVVDDDMNIIGAVYTITGDRRALWLMSRIFEQKKEMAFALEKRFQVI